MKPFKTLLTILVISLLSSPSWSETIGDLVQREGIYYKQFTDVPFSGKVTGGQQGSLKNGRKDGAWVGYWSNGQLSYKENYKNGKEDGAWIGYWENGQLRYKHNYKNGTREGVWVYYRDNGQLASKNTYKNGKEDGACLWYDEDGTLFKPMSGICKNGVKISD
jgi:antitoxin component YwqK of YwqJK toxin-antitoxin module